MLSIESERLLNYVCLGGAMTQFIGDSRYKRIMVGIDPPQDTSAEVAIGMIDELDYFNRDEDYGPVWMGEKAGYYLIRGSIESDKKDELKKQHYVIGIWDDTSVSHCD